jgi:DNA invertase Pin-like site-specific DNA recombinase
MKRVVIYSRVSTQDQTTENQVRELKEYAKRRDFEIVKLFEEKASGKNSDRIEYQKLLNIVRKRKTDCVLIWKLDRLARSTRELLERLEEFRKLGVELISLTENIDTNSSAGKALFGIIAIFSEFENDIRSERIKSGMDRAKAEGKHCGRPMTTSENVDTISKLKAEGFTDTQIMRRTGLSRNTVKKYKEAK